MAWRVHVHCLHFRRFRTANSCSERQMPTVRNWRKTNAWSWAHVWRTCKWTRVGSWTTSKTWLSKYKRRRYGKLANANKVCWKRSHRNMSRRLFNSIRPKCYLRLTRRRLCHWMNLNLRLRTSSRNWMPCLTNASRIRSRIPAQ